MVVLGGMLALNWRSWGYLGLSWSQVGGLGAILAPSWEVLGASWLQLGGLGAILAPTSEVLGTSWLQLGGSWSHLGGHGEKPTISIGLGRAPKSENRDPTTYG